MSGTPLRWREKSISGLFDLHGRIDRKLEPHITGRVLVRAHRAHSSRLFKKIVPTLRARASSEKKEIYNIGTTYCC